MATISAALVKQLRERTGAGMMECKSALQEANGDMEGAEVVLRKRGAVSAAKKSGRSARQGLIGAHVDERAGVLAEVNCESDFVARTDDFQELVQTLTTHLLHSPAESVRRSDGDASANGSQHLYDETIGPDGQTVEQFIQGKIQKTGENIVVNRFTRFALPAGRQGIVGTYLHPGSQLGVMVEFVAESVNAGDGEIESLVRDVAMQIAAADPQFLRREDVTSAALDKEKDIQRARALSEGKPEKMVDKIVEGRMNKYYEEVCLYEQPFIKENSVTVAQLVAQKGGPGAAITRFVRYKVGDTATDAPAEQPQ